MRLEEEESEEDRLILLMVGVQKARANTIYELMGQIADWAYSVGVIPVVRISVFASPKTLKKLRQRLDVRSELLDDRLVLYPKLPHWLDRKLYRMLFGGVLNFAGINLRRKY